MKMKLFAALLIVFSGAPQCVSNANAVTLPYTFSASGTIRASEVNANDQALRDAINNHAADSNAHNTRLQDVLQQNNSAGAFNLDMNSKELLNARVENKASAPVSSASNKGRLFFNTTTGYLGVDNGTTIQTIIPASSSGDITTAGTITAGQFSGPLTGSVTGNVTGNVTGTSANVTGTVAIANGGTGQTTKTASFNALSPNTTKGDVSVHNGTNNVRLGVGADGTLLTADAASAGGMKWQAFSPSSILSTANRAAQWNVVTGALEAASVTNTELGYLSGVGSSLSGINDTATLTNKTLTSPVINSPTGIVKADVGLSNVDNTSDATKNAATATLTNKTLTSPVINSPTGIVKADVGLGNVDNTSDATKNAATATLTNKTLTSPVINTPTGIVKGDVGLGNVDNTSDATKNAASATLTNKTISGASNTITNVSLATGVTSTLPIANGGTGQTAKAAAFDALSPNSTTGDLTYHNGTNNVRLAAGTTNQVLKVVAGVPGWGNVVGGGGFDQTNQLSNGDAELNATTNWTSDLTGGGTFAASSTAANLFDGSYSFAFDAAQSGNYVQQSITAPVGLYGRNCLAYLPYKGGDSTLTLQVTDGTNVLGSQALVANSTYAPAEVSFTCPSSGNIVFKILASGNSAAIYFEAYLGKNFKLGTVQNVTAWQSCTMSITADTTAPTKATSPTYDLCYMRRNGDSLELRYHYYGGVTGAAAGSGPYRFNLPTWNGSAITMDTSKISPLDDSSDGPQVGSASAYNSTANGVGYVYAASSTYLKMAVGNTSIAATPVSSTSYAMNNTNAAYKFVATVPITGWGAETALRIDQTPASWSGYHDTTCSWARTNAALGDPATDASCGLVESKNVNFGSVTGSNSLPSITFTPKRATTYWVCATAEVFDDTSLAMATVRLSDGTTVISEKSYRPYTTGGSAVASIPLCGLYSATSTSAVTLKVTSAQASGTVTITAAGVSRSAIEWSIVDIGASVSMPIIVGTVATSSTGQERVERATIANAGSASITSQSGSWLSSVTRNGTGDVQLNIAAGMFSATPTCTCTSKASDTICRGFGTTSSSVFEFIAKTGAGTATDTDFYVVCMGAK